jgi:co-chaperonin GroES (HSP10)
MSSNVSNIQEVKLTQAFPDVDCGVKPFGERIIVQIRTPKTRSEGGIILHAETVDTEKWNIQSAKVIAVGPGAFKNRDTLQPWPEGDWCKPGEYVRVPKYGGDRWNVLIPGMRARDEESYALFAIFKDLDIIGAITGDPLAMLAYI